MNVLSLFDGMSCGQIALNRAQIKYENYFASEIDKYAIKVTQKNYPNTIQLGDVNDWEHWNLPKIDLLLAGSPCQGFSNSGKGLNFNDPRSRLFFHFVNMVRVLKTKYWLLENVKMKAEWRDTITKILEVEPVLINSALVSAQNRERYYWANFSITQPEDRHIYLKDVIESGEVDREKAFTLDANYFKGGSEKTLLANYLDKSRRQVVKYQSEKRLMVLEPVALTEARTEEAKEIRRKHRKESGKDWSPRRGKQLVPRTDGKGNCLTTGLTKEHNLFDGVHYRKLTPLECERLQTVEDNYTAGVSNTQRYKMLGNGWTVDVIVHILKGIKDDNL